MRKLDSLLLAGVGVLLVHQAAYTVSSIAGVKTAVTHGHLELAWLAGSLTAIGALARAVTRSLRRRRFDQPGWLAFTGTILSGYLGLELIERVANGLAATSLLDEPVFWLGLVFAPLVALALRWSLRTVVQMVTEALERRRLDQAPTESLSTLHATSVVLSSSSILASDVLRRGPPVLSNA